MGPCTADVSLSTGTCNRRNEIGVREHTGFIPLLEEKKKGCDLNISVCILMLRAAQM